MTEIPEDVQNEAIAQMVSNLKANQGLRLQTMGDLLKISKLNPKELGKMADEPGKFHAYGMILRPKLDECVRDIEMSLYPPSTGDQDKFEISWFLWNEMLFTIITFPIEDRDAADEIAHKHKLRFRDGHVAMCIGTEDPKTNFHGVPADRFPLYGDTVASICTIHEEEDTCL